MESDSRPTRTVLRNAVSLLSRGLASRVWLTPADGVDYPTTELADAQGEADAARGTGHDCDLVGEFVHLN